MPEAETKILLIEDDDIDALVIRRMLRKLKLDHPIVRANNGEEALKILRDAEGARKELQPFIMIVDINMPRMTGFELLDEVIDDPLLSQVPIYMLSSSDSNTDKNKASQYRIRGYLVKPVTAPVLLNILDKRDDLDGSNTHSA